MNTAFRASDLRFLLALLLPAGLMYNLLFQPSQVGWWAFAIWIAVAAVDAFWPGAQRAPAAGGPVGFLVGILRIYVALQLAMLAIGLVAAERGSAWQVAALVFGVGFTTGAQGITFAHELGHSKSRFDRFLGWVLMTSVNYGHFMVEHYRGHHVRVATRDDPASARFGESLWQFLPRTLAGSWTHAWQLEALRVAQMRRSWWTSPLAWSTAINVAIVVALAAAGWHKALAFWIGQSVFAVWLLETVNYIEHYGLERAAPQGRAEPFGVMHAWNADHVLSNSLLANLQRHSDHHMHAWKPYPELEALPGPQLPTGYAGCLLLASVPRLWFRLMHRRIEWLARPRPAAP